VSLGKPVRKRHLQGYLAHKKHPHLQDPAVALYLGTCGDPRGMGVSYERGTPVCHEKDEQHAERAFSMYRGTSLARKRTPLGPYSRPMPMSPRGLLGGWASSFGRGTPVCTAYPFEPGGCGQAPMRNLSGRDIPAMKRMNNVQRERVL